MIRITIELVSAIHPSRNRVLGVGTIANDGKLGVETKGKRTAYDVRLSKWAPNTDKLWKTGRVENFDPVKRGAWDLVYLALRALVGERNP